MKISKKMGALTSGEKLDQKRASGFFSHEVNRVKKKSLSFMKEPLPQKYKNLWYLKRVNNATLAMREVVAQEFFRLLIPTHPKTRLVTNNAGNEMHVLSKQVPGFISLQSIDRFTIKKNIENNTYKGLGEVLVVSLLMNEVDLKLANMGIDNKNNIIKIDGDWCFARLIKGFESNNYTISEEEIRYLPLLHSHYAYNWLDTIQKGNYYTDHQSIAHNISTHPQFRNEVNHAILKILVLPDKLIKKFVNTYLTNSENGLIYNEIIKRKSALEEAALKNNSFNEYINSDAAKKSLSEYIDYLRHFRTTEKNYLKIEDLHESVIDQFHHQRVAIFVKCLRASLSTRVKMTRQV